MLSRVELEKSFIATSSGSVLLADSNSFYFGNSAHSYMETLNRVIGKQCKPRADAT